MPGCGLSDNGILGPGTIGSEPPHLVLILNLLHQPSSIVQININLALILVIQIIFNNLNKMPTEPATQRYVDDCVCEICIGKMIIELLNWVSTG